MMEIDRSQHCRNLRAWLSLLAVLVVASSLLQVVWASDKKGVGLASLNQPERIEALNVAWYYTWKPYPIRGVSHAQFVPMISGVRLFERQLAYQKSQPKADVLLVFNEPNKKHQSNRTVEEVLDLWPRFDGMAKRLSSPAAAGVMGRWFDRFAKEARRREVKFDFMAVHLYGPPDVALFLNKLDAVHRKFGMPIWLTEFAVADWSAGRRGGNRYSEAQVLAFMQRLLPELEKRPYIERYAWFGAGDYASRHASLRSSRLFGENGSLTRLGRFYADFDWPSGDEAARLFGHRGASSYTALSPFRALP